MSKIFALGSLGFFGVAFFFLAGLVISTAMWAGIIWLLEYIAHAGNLTTIELTNNQLWAAALIVAIVRVAFSSSKASAN